MSILSSLFGSKKRAKKTTASTARPNSPPSPPAKPKARASSPSNDKGGPGRFLSLRRKSSAAAYETVKRRSSGEFGGRKQAAAAPGEEWRLPNLGFVDEGNGEAEARSGLGLDNVGRIPTLTKEEGERLGRASLDAGQAGKIWKVLGVVLKHTDLPGIVLETLPSGLEAQEHALRVLSLLAAQPESLANYPSISSHYPSPSATDPSSLWWDRLLDLARSVSPHAVASALKWTLRRLTPESSTPFITPSAYITFVQAEHAASYPLDAYITILSVYLPPPVRQILHEIFDVWAALTARTEDKSGLGGKLSLLMGWWILQPEREADVKWEEMYADWRLAARRSEHVFLAWIRHQSTTHTLPTRLSALVEKYPFGYSEYSAETLPSPPPSSFTRRTLHLSLHTDQPLSKLSLSPSEILKAAQTARPAEDVSVAVWEAISSDSEAAQQLVQLVDEESAVFLARSGDDSHTLAKKTVTPPPRRASLFEGRAEMAPLHRMPSNGKLLDTLAEEVGKLAESHTPTESIQHKPSASRLRMPESTSTWDDFTKSGFSEERDGDLDLALTPSASVQTFTSFVPTPRVQPLGTSAVTTPVASPSRKTAFAPVAKYSIFREEVVDTDEMFIGFAEDGQLDAASSAKWPVFTLLRLKAPHTAGEDVIERLLITVEYRAPPRPPTTPMRSLPVDSSSPSSSPTGESSGFRFGPFGFKRSTSKPGLGFRSSFFSSSRVSLLKDDKGADLFTDGETIYKHANGKTRSGIFGGSVDELALRKSRSPEVPMERKSRKAVPPFLSPPKSAGVLPLVEPVSAPAPPAEASDAVEPGHEPASATSQSIAGETTSVTGSITATGTPCVDPANKELLKAPSAPPPIASVNANLAGPALSPIGPSAETSPSDWVYGAEGGAHVVFMYTGEIVPYIGKLLRIRKISTHRGDPLEETSALWREKLLPRLLPDRLLVTAEKIQVEGKWLKALLEQSEAGRPEARRTKGSLVEEIGTEPKISLMENLRMADGRLIGRRVLSVEIKPKWGFLPSADQIQPPEAAAIKSQIGRYTMHQHYRGETPKEGRYDPLDLFSGDEERIKHALVGLWSIWRETGGQANSFRVFVDGNIVHPDEADTEGSLLRVTAPILIPLLRNSDILPVLRHLQSSLDLTDISDIVARYRAAHPEAPLFDESIVTDILPSELTAFINKYLSHPTLDQPTQEWSLRERIISYSLSAIFKDCSIIIRAVLAPSIPEEGKWMVEDRGSTVRLLDLDLKPLKMRHWAELDEKIWRHWAGTKGVDGAAEEREVGAATVEVQPLADRALVLPIDAHGVSPGKIVPGGFPGIPDVPLGTPALETGPSGLASESAEAFSSSEPQIEESTTTEARNVRLAHAWYLSCFDGLEEASKRFFAEQDKEGMMAALEPLHGMVDQAPETAEEVAFLQRFSQDLAAARGYLKNGAASDEMELQNAWDLYYKVYQQIHKQLLSLGLVHPPKPISPSDRIPDPRLAQHAGEASGLPETAETGLVAPHVVDKDAAEMNGDGVHQGEQGGGIETASSSVFSTPMVPGAFNFPDMSKSTPAADVAADPAKPLRPSASLPGPSEALDSDAESTPDSPLDSRYQRSFAPSPSPAPLPENPTSDASHPTTTDTSVVFLDSPTFGRAESIHSIESGSSVTEELSRQSSVDIIRVESITPTTPPRSPKPAMIVLGESAETPTQRNFPVARGLPQMSPRAGSPLDQVQRSVPGSPSTPSRPERRRVDSLPQVHAAPVDVAGADARG